MPSIPPSLGEKLTQAWEFCVEHRAPILQGLWLLAILVFFACFKIPYAEHVSNPEIDGGYYTSVAEFVRDGYGLKTNISLYHQAYSYFPHPTSVSPLWPLLYGLTAKIAPLYKVAIWLPTLLYFVSIILAFGWGRALFGRDLTRALPGFNAGHVIALMLGMHKEYFQFTSHPYTEGLAFTLLFGCLWRFHVMLGKPKKWHGIEMGVWLAVLFLCRAQLIIVAMALFPALGWYVVFGRERRVHALLLAESVASFGLIIGLWYLHLRTFVGAGPIAALLRFDQGWETKSLSTFTPVIHKPTIEQWLSDRWHGFDIAFREGGRYAYARSFYTFQYAVPAATAVLAVLGLTSLRREKIRQTWDWLRSPAALPWIFVVVLALGGFLSIHTIHKSYFSVWHFARRQALTAILLFYLSLIFMFRRRWIGPALAALILCSGLHDGYDQLDDLKDSAVRHPARQFDDTHSALVKWLEDQRAKQGDFSVALSAQDPQRIGFLTPHIGYHWIYWRTTYDDIETLVHKFKVKYIILSGRATRWGFARDKRFRKNFKRVAYHSGAVIYAPK